LEVRKDEWLKEVDNQTEFLDQVGDRLPGEIREEQKKLKDRLEA